MSDRTGELYAVMETLADWLDTIDEQCCPMGSHCPRCWRVAATAQILELTQLLLAEHQQTVEKMNEFIGAMHMAREQAQSATRLVVANAGEAQKFIRP